LPIFVVVANGLEPCVVYGRKRPTLKNQGWGTRVDGAGKMPALPVVAKDQAGVREVNLP